MAPKNHSNLAAELGLPPGLDLDPGWLLELVDDKEAARLLGFARPEQMRARRWRGDGPPYVRLTDHSRGRVRYRRIDLLRWAASRRHEHTSAETWTDMAVGAMDSES